MIRYVPNSLTIFRLLALPVFFWLYGTQVPGIAWKATILMSIAALTDVADGHIARRFNVTSEFGRILDPFVDRAFFLTCFSAYIFYGTMPWWAAAPVLARDVLLLLVTIVLFGRAREKPRVMQIGRYANIVLALAVGAFMIDVRLAAWPLYVAGAGLYLASGALYGIRWARERRAERAGGQHTG
jgi:CDP-diacylglycerol--glycerol-3-phosphate 3-phosphatidyltransferase